MRIDLILPERLLDQPPRLYSAVALVIEATGLAGVDLERALRCGVVSGEMARERLLDLAATDVVEQVCLPGDADAQSRLRAVLARRGAPLDGPAAGRPAAGDPRPGDGAADPRQST